jgi:hypothetical protein
MMETPTAGSIRLGWSLRGTCKEEFGRNER